MNNEDPERRPVTLVVDPSLSAEERDRLVRKLVRAVGYQDQIPRSMTDANEVSRSSEYRPAGCLIWLSIVFGLTVVGLHNIRGVSWWWMTVIAIPLLLSGIVYLKSAPNRESDELDSSDLSRCVLPRDLDIPSYQLLRRTQNAIRAVLESGVYGRHSSDHSVEESALRRHEWEIAIALKDISKLSRELDRSMEGGLPGPMTVAVLDSQRQALTLAKGATTSRISALERYASELHMADDAERDWQTALKASSRNDQYLDLVARTAADEHAVSELQGLTEQAAAAAEAFREHLYQASLAAEALVFPATPQN